MRPIWIVLVLLWASLSHAQLPISRELAVIDLGQKLFEDPLLSRDGTISCSSCHQLDKGGSDSLRTSKGIGGQFGELNAPTVVNASRQQLQFWDQRADSLQVQSLGPLTNAVEMGNDTVADVLNNIAGVPYYRERFRVLYRDGITRATFQDAITKYENTLQCSNAPITQYLAGKTNAMSDAGLRGWIAFKRVGCVDCHKPENYFRDGMAHNTGVSFMRGGRQRGRADVAGVQDTDENIRAFKTPMLYNIATSAPYMHDGSFDTIRDVIAWYASGGRFTRDNHRSYNRDRLIDKRVAAMDGKISRQEMQDLEVFLTYETVCIDYPKYHLAKLPPR